MFPFEGFARAPRPYQFARAVEDALENGNAALGAEHNPDGTHGPIAVLEVTDEALVDGPLEHNGPALVDVASGVDEGVYNVTLTGTTNNLALPDGRSIRSRLVRCDAAADRTLTGIVPYNEEKYQQLCLINSSSFTITLSHNSGSSAARHRFSLPSDANFLLRSGRVLDLWYDASSGVWRCQEVGVVQVRTVFTQELSFANAGGSTQNFTLSTTLSDYTKAVIADWQEDVSGGGQPTHSRKLTSNTNLAVSGSDAAGHTFRVTIVEYQNLLA